MKKYEAVRIPVLVLSLVLFLASSGLADVVPGDVIDKTNWEKVRGLVPDSILTWVKGGKIVLNIGELSYEPFDYIPPFAQEAYVTSAGKYGLDEDHWVVEAETGRRAEYIPSWPFPEIDPKDPKAGEKVMYNNLSGVHSLGDIRASIPMLFISPSGYERSLDLAALQSSRDGNPKYAGEENPEGLLSQQILVVRDPYDMAGMAVMTWRFRDPGKEDTVFGYAPAIRRVRRMSPANRSDALFGSDMANDDASIYSGKVSAMEWKLLRKQEALLPFSYNDPEVIVQNDRGEWETPIKGRILLYGYEKEGWQGAPWAPVDWVWVKRPTYVIEMRPRDRYYNYGVQEIWIAADIPTTSCKIIHDRSGRYWKTIFKARMVGRSADGTLSLTYMGDQITVDERSSHATIIKGVGPKNQFTYYANVDLNLFSLAGFQKYCK